eukprot:165100_1
MDGLIKTFQILNVDKDESVENLRQIVNIHEDSILPEFYVKSDGDEELLILVEFSKPINLQSIQIHAQKIGMDGMSPPKQIHIYKLNDLSINFDDLSALKPELKSIKWSSKKINLQKRAKVAIKFKEIQYLAIYIDQNQNDTESTYFNAINFKGQIGNIELKKDVEDEKNQKILQDIASNDHHINEEKSPSDSLLDRTNIYVGLYSQCDIKTCPSLSRICDVLLNYSSYLLSIESMNEDDEDDTSFVDNIYAEITDKYNSVDLLNDFNHLLMDHIEHFEYIHDVLLDRIHGTKPCKLSTCLSLKRNQRDRAEITEKDIILRSLYFHNDETVEQQILDRIHCHFLHTFDIGFRLTQKERQNVSNDIKRISEIMARKRNLYSSMNQLGRLSPFHNKFSHNFSANDDNEKMEEFSYGYRYFYWSHYKNNKSKGDDVLEKVWGKPQNFDDSTVETRPYQPNGDCTVGEWYIAKKYDSFKRELLQNATSCISETQWIQLMEKAEIHIKTKKCREYLCVQDETAYCYEMKYEDPMMKHHLIALLVYCGFDDLQRKFSETFRKQDKTESIKDLQKRHRHYYFLGRYLRECVECFGTKSSTLQTLTVYHGINKQFTFPSINAYIHGPCSTTTDYGVALNFGGGNGTILKLGINTSTWSITQNQGQNTAVFMMNGICSTIACFDCCWISEFSNESEIFCIGGLWPLQFQTMIDLSLHINYKRYILALKQLTFGMTAGASMNFVVDKINETQNITKSQQKEIEQISFRLISHEIWRRKANHKLAIKFESCPNMIQKTMRSTFLWVNTIIFFQKGHKVKHNLFKYDNQWIKLELLTMLFPNTTCITYIATQKDITFFTKPLIYDDVLSFFLNISSKIESILIRIPNELKDAISKYIKMYCYKFERCGYKLQLFHFQRARAKSIINGFGVAKPIIHELIKTMDKNAIDGMYGSYDIDESLDYYSIGMFRAIK